jgi:hypothetical protein
MTHSTRPSIRGPVAMRTGRSLPTTCVSPALRHSHALRASRWISLMVVVAAALGCGKKGPPLAPFVRVPALVTAVAPQRVGNDVYVSFAVPETNVDGQKPADIATVEVYAVTADRPPTTEKQRELATLVAMLPVRPILPALPVAANGSAPPPLPVLPGVERGAAVAIREPLTAEARLPVELPLEKPVVVVEPPIDETQERIGPLVALADARASRRRRCRCRLKPAAPRRGRRWSRIPPAK